ncbi:DNA sulfur modification protein DndB [Paenibacillus larvae]
MKQFLKLKGTVLPIDERQPIKGLMTTQIKVKNLLKIYLIDSEVNRDININRIPKIEKYIDTFESNLGIYFPAIMCNIQLKEFNYDEENSALTIYPNEKLVIIDGQHRITGLERYLSTMKESDIRKVKILDSMLTLQLYINLDKAEQRELFTSINSNAKKVSMSLTTSYDSRDILNILAKDILSISESLQSLGVETNKSRLARPKNKNLTSMTRLKTFLSLLLFGKPTLSNSNEQLIKENYDSVLNFLERLFYNLYSDLNSNSIFPREPGNVKKYVLGHEAVLNALAIYLNRKIVVAQNDGFLFHHDLDDFLETLTLIDWSVEDSSWKPFLQVAQRGQSTEFKTIDLKFQDAIAEYLTDVLS